MKKTGKPREGIITEETEVLILDLQKQENLTDNCLIFNYTSHNLLVMLNRFLK